MMESVSDLERDGNDLRMNIVKQPEDDEEESDDGEDQNADEEANDDEDGIEDEVDRQNMRSEDENDGDNEDGITKTSLYHLIILNVPPELCIVYRANLRILASPALAVASK